MRTNESLRMDNLFPHSFVGLGDPHKVFKKYSLPKMRRDNNAQYRRPFSHRADTLRFASASLQMPKFTKDSFSAVSNSQDAIVKKKESQSKTVDLSKWNATDIHEWILSIDAVRFGKYKNLKQRLNEEQLSGNDLIFVTEQDVKDFGINVFGDRKLLFSSIQELTKQKSSSPFDEAVDDSSIPDGFLDPITYELMVDPVQSPSGHTYERKTIEQWIKENGVDPIS